MRSADSQTVENILLRRSFLAQAGVGLGSIAAANLLSRDAMAKDAGLPGALSGTGAPPHFPAKAKRVIFLYMSGGPSHLETFDYKPELDKLDGKPMPSSFTSGQPIAQLQITDHARDEGFAIPRRKDEQVRPVAADEVALKFLAARNIGRGRAAGRGENVIARAAFQKVPSTGS